MKYILVKFSKYRFIIFQIVFLILLSFIVLVQRQNSNLIRATNQPMPITEVRDVPIIPQLPSLPTGCEATSTAMLLQWADLDVSKEELASALPKGIMPFKYKDIMYGDNPNNAFIGDPFSPQGYGVFHRPIKDLINYYLPGIAKDITGCKYEDLIAVIDSGRPVIVWVTIGMKKPRVSKTWYDAKGNEVQWKIPQHTVLMVGYTSSHVIFHDPWSGNKEYCNTTLFKEIWTQMGSQAITLALNNNLNTNQK